MFLFSFYDTPVVFVWVVFNHLVCHQFVYNISGGLNQNDKEYGNEDNWGGNDEQLNLESSLPITLKGK